MLIKFPERAWAVGIDKVKTVISSWLKEKFFTHSPGVYVISWNFE